MPLQREEYVELGWRRAIEAAVKAIKTCPSLDENGYVLDGNQVAKTVKALSNSPDLT